MIFEIFILVLAIVLASVRASVCSQHRNIADRALKRKLVDNVVNILLFLAVFFLMYMEYSACFTVSTFCTLSILLCLFLRRKKILERAKRMYDKMLEGIAFSAGIKKTLQRMLKNRNLSGSMRKKEEKNTELHKQQIYREYILLTLVLFSKRFIIANLMIVFLGHVLAIIEPQRFSLFVEQMKFLPHYIPRVLILINNMGLIFSIWKFHCNYKEIEQEMTENERYIKLRKRLDSKEHEI